TDERETDRSIRCDDDVLRDVRFARDVDANPVAGLHEPAGRNGRPGKARRCSEDRRAEYRRAPHHHSAATNKLKCSSCRAFNAATPAGTIIIPGSRCVARTSGDVESTRAISL